MSGAINSNFEADVDDPSWPHYSRTILLISLAEALTVDLRFPLNPAVRQTLSTAFEPGQFAMITPCNPRGRSVSKELNERRVQALEAALVASGRTYARAIGASPDGTHSEPGFAIDLSLSGAIKLAVSWEQSALFWFDGASFWLVPAFGGAEAKRLPQVGDKQGS